MSGFVLPPNSAECFLSDYDPVMETTNAGQPDLYPFRYVPHRSRHETGPNGLVAATALLQREQNASQHTVNMTSYDAPVWPHSVPMSKFMLSVRLENFRLLENAAEQRGISVQELLRAVIIPDWVHKVASETIKPYLRPLQFAKERLASAPLRA